jgi:hypothetical protein
MTLTPNFKYNNGSSVILSTALHVMRPNLALQRMAGRGLCVSVRSAGCVLMRSRCLATRCVQGCCATSLAAGVAGWLTLGPAHVMDPEDCVRQVNKHHDKTDLLKMMDFFLAIFTLHIPQSHKTPKKKKQIRMNVSALL